GSATWSKNRSLPFQTLRGRWPSVERAILTISDQRYGSLAHLITEAVSWPTQLVAQGKCHRQIHFQVVRRNRLQEPLVIETANDAIEHQCSQMAINGFLIFGVA